jgi:putative ABC transport system ATP-binding protein
MTVANPTDFPTMPLETRETSPRELRLGLNWLCAQGNSSAAASERHEALSTEHINEEPAIIELAEAARRLGVHVLIKEKALAALEHADLPALLFDDAGRAITLEATSASGRLREVRVTKLSIPKVLEVPIASLSQALGLANDSTSLLKPASMQTAAFWQQSPESKSPFGQLYRLATLEKSTIVTAMLYGIASGLLSLAAPVAVQLLVTSIAFQGTRQPIVVLVSLVSLALALAVVTRSLQAYVVERLQERLFVRFALDLGQRLSLAEREGLKERGGTDLVHRFFDIMTLQKGAATIFLDSIFIVLEVFFGALLLAFYHPLLLAFSVILISLSIAVIFGLGQGAVKTSVKESKAKYHAASNLTDIVLATVNRREGVTRALERNEELTIEYLEARRKHFKYVFRQTIGFYSIYAIATSALLGVGGALVSIGSITLGQLVAAELVVTATVGGLSKLGKHLENIYDMAASVDKLSAFGEIPLRKQSGLRLPKGPFEILVRNVAVGPLSDLSFRIPGGTLVVVSGPENSGKSSVLDAIFGERTPKAGEVLLAGHRFSELDPEQVRQRMFMVRELDALSTYVDQNKTLEDYLSMRCSKSAILRLEQVMRETGLIDLVNRLPAGVRTKLHVLNLSRSEIILLEATRAVLEEASVLAIEGLRIDSAIDLKILRAIRKSRPNMTVLVTANKTEALPVSGQILELPSGQMFEVKAS